MGKTLLVPLMFVASGCMRPVTLSDAPKQQGEDTIQSFIVVLSDAERVRITPDAYKLRHLKRHWRRYTIADFEKDVRRAVAASDRRLTASEMEGVVFRTLHVHPIGDGPGGPLPYRIGDFATVGVVSSP